MGGDIAVLHAFADQSHDFAFALRQSGRASALARLPLAAPAFLKDARRDWGPARDFVEAQWLMLPQETPEDFVIATGEQHSVREFVELAASELGMRIHWTGQGVDERGIDAKSGRTVVRVDPRYFRPAEVETLLGNPAKAEAKLGWRRTVTFPALVAEMARHDLALAERDALMARSGYRTAQNYE